MTLPAATAWNQKYGSQEYVTSFEAKLIFRKANLGRENKRKQYTLRRKRWNEPAISKVSMLNEILKSCHPRRYLCLRSTVFYELELFHWTKVMSQGAADSKLQVVSFHFQIEWQKELQSVFLSSPHPIHKMITLHPNLLRVSHYKRVKKKTKSRLMPYVRPTYAAPGQNKAQYFLMHLCVCVRRCYRNHQIIMPRLFG